MTVAYEPNQIDNLDKVHQLDSKELDVVWVAELVTSKSKSEKSGDEGGEGDS